MCGTKNFSSVRWYSAPQLLHLTIVAISEICAPLTHFPVWMAAIFKLTHDQLLRLFSAVPKFSGRKTRFLWYDICFRHGLGCEMAVYRLLRNSSLKPEQISRLEALTNKRCNALR